MNDSLDDLLTSNMTISNGATATSGGGYTISIDPSIWNSTTFTVGSGASVTDTTFNWSVECTPFEDGFPEWEDFQEMCKEYPALQTSYEHLKVFYKLSIDDWKSKKKGNDNV